MDAKKTHAHNLARQGTASKPRCIAVWQAEEPTQPESQAAISKRAYNSSGQQIGVALNSRPSPIRTMVSDPVHQGRIESNVAARLLRFQPLVAKNLVTLNQELPVEGRTMKQRVRLTPGISVICHTNESQTRETSLHRTIPK